MIEVDGFSGKANVLGRVLRVELLAGGGAGSGSSLMIHGLTYVDAMEVLNALDTDRLRTAPELRVAEPAGRQAYQERVGIAHEGSGPAPGPAVRQGIGDAQARPVLPVPRDPKAPANTIPPEVRGATDLRPVVEWLWAGSHHLPEAQVETMKALADTGHCPLLATMFATMAEQAIFAEVVGTMKALGYATDGTAAKAPSSPVAASEPAPAPVAPARPPAASPGAAAAHAEAPSEVPEVVAKAQHLRVVVDYVVERLPADQRKTPSLDAVTRGVLALSSAVPMVARIEASKLRARVERTMVSMELLPVT